MLTKWLLVSSAAGLFFIARRRGSEREKEDEGGALDPKGDKSYKSSGA